MQIRQINPLLRALWPPDSACRQFPGTGLSFAKNSTNLPILHPKTPNCTLIWFFISNNFLDFFGSLVKTAFKKYFFLVINYFNTVVAQKYCTFSSPAPPSESLTKKLKKVVILQLNYSLEKIGLLSDRGRRFGVILSGGRGVKKHAIFLSTNGIN